MALFFRKTNRFDGTYIQWDSIAPVARSSNSTLYMNGKPIMPIEIEDFQDMIDRKVYRTLSPSGTYELSIIEA